MADTLEWKARLADDGDPWPEEIFGDEGADAHGT